MKDNFLNAYRFLRALTGRPSQDNFNIPSTELVDFHPCQHKRLTLKEVEKWCDINGYEEPYQSGGEWCAYPKGGLISIPINPQTFISADN